MRYNHRRRWSTSGRLQFGFLSRRRLLQLGGGAGGLLLLGGSGAVGLRGCAPAVEGLAQLSAQEYRTLASLARTHLPTGGAFPEGADDFDLARVFDGFLSGEPHENVRDLRRALLLMEYGPVLFGGAAATFSHLADPARLAHWESWMTSDLLVRRQVSVAFRKFLSLVFFDQERVWPSIGYGGPSFGGAP